MAKPFDATTKHLVEAEPEAWLRYLGFPPTGPAEVVSPDLATVTAEADHVLRVDAPEPWLAQIEFQSSYDRSLAQRLLRYSVLLQGRYDVPVRSIVVLLRTEADGPEMAGEIEHRLPDEAEAYLRYRYRIVRAWRQPVDGVLAGGLATLPMAPLADVTPERLPAVIRRMDERLRREATPQQAGTLWTATYVLMGLRYPAELARRLVEGVARMRESATYQAILIEGREEGRQEGRADEARRLLLLQGRRRFGPPDAGTVAALDAITEIEQLEALGVRLLDVGSWEELLAVPAR